jgi:hypothetical protein
LEITIFASSTASGSADSGDRPSFARTEIAAMLNSSIVRVVVLTGENSKQAWEKMIKDFGREDEERFPVSDLGDHAYALHLKPRTEHDYPTALVAVTSGFHIKFRLGRAGAAR